MASGIYKITCPLSDKTYIGSAVNIENRWAAHRSRLNNNKHENAHLQNAWNKYGEELFNFFVVENVEDPIQLIVTEQKWIDSFLPEMLFNICLTAGSPIRKLTEETKQKIRKSNLGKKRTQKTCKNISESKMGHVVSEKTRQKMSDAAKGRQHTPDAKQKIADSLVKMWGKISNETRQKILENLKYERKGRISNFKGKKHSAESIQKISIARQGKIASLHPPEAKTYWAKHQESI
jgi:group I intron endonuclease